MSTQKINNVDRFFRLLLIKTYKTIFHLLGMAIFLSQILLLGFNELLTLDSNILPVQLFILAVNFFMVNFLLEKLGINKLMSNEHNKLLK